MAKRWRQHAGDSRSWRSERRTLCNLRHKAPRILKVCKVMCRPESDRVRRDGHPLAIATRPLSETRFKPWRCSFSRFCAYCPTHTMASSPMLPQCFRLSVVKLMWGPSSSLAMMFFSAREKSFWMPRSVTRGHFDRVKSRKTGDAIKGAIAWRATSDSNVHRFTSRRCKPRHPCTIQ